MDLALVLVVVFLVVDFVISIWNGYAAGVSLALLKGRPEARFSRVAAYAGLGLGFTGMAYVMTVVFGFLAAYTGFIGAADLAYILAFDFLVFGACIIGFGMVVTAQSIAIAYRRRDFRSIAISAWNVFAEVWDLAIYAEGFRAAYTTMKGGSNDRGNVYAVVLIAALVALFITYAAYRHGYRRAERALLPQADYRPRGGPSPA